jgi:hypothetical protein
MRLFRKILVLILLLPTLAKGADLVFPKDPTAKEKAFLTAMNKAITTTNIDALVALQYFDQSEFLKNQFRSFFQEMVSSECVSLTLERVDPATATERVEGTDKVRENLPVRWIVRVTHRPPSPGATMITTLRAGLLNGKIRITTANVVGVVEKSGH